MLKNLYEKTLKLAAHKSSKFYLSVISFAESSFFPIPPDVMIIPMALAKKNEYLKCVIWKKEKRNMKCENVKPFFWRRGGHWSDFKGTLGTKIFQCTSAAVGGRKNLWGEKWIRIHF